MAETFHLFPDLPKELRLQIWKQAMIEARPDRRIIVYQLRVVPFKQSISPLLLVNHESRTCAKAFYNVKLDVYAIPPLSDSQIKYMDKKKQWDRIPGIERAVDGKIHGYTDPYTRSLYAELQLQLEYDIGYYECRGFDEDDELRKEESLSLKREEKEYTVVLEEHWSEFVENQLRYFGSQSADEAETSGLTKGALYISPEHDVFIEGYECGRHFYVDNRSNIFGADLEQRLTCHHISAMLNSALREKITTLVLVRPQGAGSPNHCVFAHCREIDYGCQLLSHRGNMDWRQTTFPSVRSYFKLRPRRYTEPGFLRQVIEADGPELSEILEQWVNKGPSLDRKGRTVWNFKKTTSFDRIFDKRLEPADWTRELMAHWDVGQDDSVCEMMAHCEISN